MTTANDGQPAEATSGGWPILPLPDLSQSYADLPRSWQIGAVLLANRLLAAAYRADVLEVADRVHQDVQAGLVKDMTVEEYVEEATEGHPRVVDVNQALQTLQYSPLATPMTDAIAASCLRYALVAFQGDVEHELHQRGLDAVAGHPPLADNPF